MSIPRVYKIETVKERDQSMGSCSCKELLRLHHIRVTIHWQD